MVPAKPAVSIIIPCRNEKNFIAKCLESVFSFDPVPEGMEVIVVDGMSDDGTRDVLTHWVKHSGIRLLDNPTRIVPTAMNIGIEAARGNLILRLDAHAEYPKNYLQLCLETSDRTGADNVGGVFETIPRDGSIEATLVQALTTHRFGVGNANFRLNALEGMADTVPFGCFRREVFVRIGGYDERLVRNQDYELNRRLIYLGGKVWLNPNIRTSYYNQESLRGLMRQAFVNGQWNTWMWYLASYAFAWRHIIPGIFVLSLIGLLLLSSVVSQVMPILFFILAVYGLLALTTSIQQSRRYGWWMAPLLPFLFLTYHFVYGAGTLWGGLWLVIGCSPVQR
jgi:succinoglycan biosynthesis protein ExoA